MAQAKILVTGATGKTGGALVAQLRARDVPVRALVRRRDARTAVLERRGVEIVVGDLFDAESLIGAMQGVQRAYYCPPWHGHMIQSATAFAVAAREARLEHVVGLSQWLAGPSHPSLESRQHWLADAVFEMMPGVGYTRLNPGFFADSYLLLMPYATLLGVFPMPVDPDSRNAPPSNEDIARVAAHALLDPDRHAGRSYRPTGPRVLSVREMIAIMSRVAGRTVMHVRMPIGLFYKAARKDGFDEGLLSGFGSYLVDHAQDAFAFGGATDDVLNVTGQAPEDFETIARRYAQAPHARRTLANTLRAFAGFMATPFYPGFDPAAFARAQNHPVPLAPTSAMQSPRWRAEHARELAPMRAPHLAVAE